MHCEKCGATFESDVSVCPECGENLKSENAKENTEYLDAEESKKEEFEKTDVDEDKAPKKIKRLSKRKAILISALAFFVVAVIAGGTILGCYLNEPIVKIGRAFDKTLFKSSSIDISVKIDKFLVDNELTASIDFGEGIKGSYFEGSYKTRKTENKISVKNGIVYINGAEKTSVDEFIKQAEKSGNEYEKLAVKLLNALDKAIDGKLDEKTLKAFIEDELIPYYAKSSGTKVPSYEETVKAFKEVLKESEKNGVLTITKTKQEKAEIFEISANTEELINCIFTLSNENETVAAYVDMFVNAAGDISGGFINSKKDIEMLLPSIIGSELDFRMAIESGRVTEIWLTDDISVKIKSEK